MSGAMERKIVTSFVYPPIPVRDFDWCAYYDGEEEAGHYGYGRTEAEAIQDFIENYQDEEDERLGLRPTPSSPEPREQDNGKP